MEFSPNVAALETSATIALSSRVKRMIAEGRDVLDLCVGEPDFPTPRFIAEAGIRAIREGRTRYAPAPGLPELRQAIAADLSRLSAANHRADPAGVVVSSGGKQALFNVCFSLFGPGDRVLVPAPYWTSYPEIVRLARAEPAIVPGDPDRSWRVGPEALERAASSSVRGLLLNSPGNPSGAVYSRAELRAIAEWAAERRIWLISDEIYRRIHFGSPVAPGILDLPDALLEQAVVVDGASKAFAMTGWRIGFSYSGPAVATKAAALQTQTTSSATTPAQYAALAAYRAEGDERAEIDAMRTAFEHRRDLLVDLFRERLPEIGFVHPQGAFYLWFETAALAREGEDSIALCERLLSEAGLGLVPGAAFGDDHHVRLSFAHSEETLREAVDRLTRFITTR